ncbi:MAG: hypothetical protein M3Q19_01710 [Pseudomonadota bacterium]|nr:hypothetical protein [Pseudomonadota bacterium]
MLALFAAVLAASTPTPVLEASVPWWERITVTVDDKGKQQSCQYEMSLSPAGAKACDEATAASVKAGSDGRSSRYSKVTFERRFSPGRQLDSGRLQPGDELLGRQVMFLTFAAEGTIETCRVVATTGDMAFQYDCDEARKEQFRVQESAGPGARQAFMTVLAYGHSEQIA